MEKQREQWKRSREKGQLPEAKWVWTAIGWKNDVLVLLILAGFAFWINRGMEIKGLYMDDLYLWSCYGEQSFLEYVFPMGSTRFRFLYYLAAWLEFAVIGTHLERIVVINILMNIGVAFTIYRMGRSFSRSTYIGALAGLVYLASRMAYYQIGQVYGLMETMALWMAIGILYLLCRYLNTKDTDGKKEFAAACGLYTAVCFVHERYMVLLPLFFLVLVLRRAKDWKLWAASAASFAAVQLIRLVTIGGLSPAGTGGTDVADTFSLKTAIHYAFSQVAYVFGVNAGPEHLNGQNFRQAPIWVMLLIAAADLMLVGMVVAFAAHCIMHRKRAFSYIGTSLLFLGFIAGCIACSSVTIRVEMRWVYVSYAAALLYLCWLYGILTEGMLKMGVWVQAVPYLAMITVYAVLTLPTELYYRSLYPKLYYWADQQRYNSLAEETYGTYGDQIFGKTIYIIGNTYEMSDFTANTFFKVFDPERKAEGTQVVHINDIRDIGLVTEDMLVLAEEPQLNRFQDVTQTVRNMKCRTLYGYYEDGWMDERAEMQVMAGRSGEITMDFYYPRELTQDQWVTVYVDREPEIYLQFEQELMHTAIQVRPYQVVQLRFETNFYVPDAQEQRGVRKLAAILKLTAD